MRRYLSLFLFVVVTLASCEGARNNSSWSTAEKGTEIVPSLEKSAPADSTGAKTDATASPKAKH
jgi:hypothetical protein